MVAVSAQLSSAGWTASAALPSCTVVPSFAQFTTWYALGPWLLLTSRISFALLNAQPAVVKVVLKLTLVP